jgi:hypothetical protein
MMFTATNQPHNLGIHGNLIWTIQFWVHSEIAVEPNVTFMLNLITTFSCNLFFSLFFSCQIAYLKIIFQSKMYKCLHLKFWMCIELGLSSRTSSSSSPTSSSSYLKKTLEWFQFRFHKRMAPWVLFRSGSWKFEKNQISVPELRPGSGFGKPGLKPAINCWLNLRFSNFSPPKSFFFLKILVPEPDLILNPVPQKPDPVLVWFW